LFPEHANPKGSLVLFHYWYSQYKYRIIYKDKQKYFEAKIIIPGTVKSKIFFIYISLLVLTVQISYYL
jgi:hypothetical protein